MKCAGKCKRDLPQTAFKFRTDRGNYRTVCKECDGERVRARRKGRNPDAGKEPNGWPVPRADLLESLACIQFRKWGGPVNRDQPMRWSLAA